jgi:hypothetical protein
MIPHYTKAIADAKKVLSEAFAEADRKLQDSGLRLGDVEIATSQLRNGLVQGCADTMIINISVSMHAVDLNENTVFTGK